MGVGSAVLVDRPDLERIRRIADVEDANTLPCGRITYIRRDTCAALGTGQDRVDRQEQDVGPAIAVAVPDRDVILRSWTADVGY